jgi:hypothetical protein
MTIEERLERLERENKRLKYLLFSLFFLIAGVFFIGATTMKKESPIPDEIKARKFTLFDEVGKVRAVLSMWQGVPVLALYDEEGKFRAGLRGGKDVSCLDLDDGKGKVKVSLGVKTSRPEEFIPLSEPYLVLYGIQHEAGIDFYSNSGLFSQPRFFMCPIEEPKEGKTLKGLYLYLANADEPEICLNGSKYQTGINTSGFSISSSEKSKEGEASKNLFLGLTREPKLHLAGSKYQIDIATGGAAPLPVIGLVGLQAGISIKPIAYQEGSQEYLKQIELGFRGRGILAKSQEEPCLSLSGSKYKVEAGELDLLGTGISISPILHSTEPSEWEEEMKRKQEAIYLTLEKGNACLHLWGNNGQGVDISTSIKSKDEPYIALFPSGERLPKASLSILNGEGCLDLYDNWDNLKFFK